jgi:hypothetical protein
MTKKQDFIYFIAASKYCFDSLTTSVASNIQPFKLKAYLNKKFIIKI